MDIETYVEKAHSFAEYEDERYVSYGLAAERGELLGVYAKAYRGDYPIGGEVFKEKLKKECGDLFWLFNESNILAHGDGLKPRDLEPTYNNMAEQRVLDWAAEGELFSDDLVVLLEKYGISVEECLQANIDKLEKRKDNGTIKGDGDDR